LFAALEELPAEERRFDLITANPPYIGEGELAGLMAEVRDHEPHEALIAGATGLEIIERILAEGPEHLAAGGQLLMEIGFAQAAAVRELAEKNKDWEWLGSRKDFGGHERVVKLRIKN
jgi:release factor glutamine methyltransferase